MSRSRSALRPASRPACSPCRPTTSSASRLTRSIPSTVKSEVVAGENAQIAVMLTPSIREGTIRGRVSDDKDKPLEGTDIEITGPTSTHVMVGSDGTFETKAVAGKYTVIASKEGFLK